MFNKPTLAKGLMRFKKEAAAVLVGASLIISPMTGTAGGIPVFDGVALGQSIQEYLTMMMQLENLRQSLTQLRNNYDQLRTTHQNFTGNRGFGGWQTDLRQYAWVARDIENTLDNISELGVTALSGEARSAYNRFNFGAKCAEIKSPETRASCERNAAMQAFHYATLKTSYNSSLTHLNQIKSLYDRISMTTDAKGIAELQARITNENNAINTEQARLDALDKMIRQQTEVAELQVQNTLVKESTPDPEFRRQHMRLIR